MAAQDVEVIKIDTGAAQTSVKELRKQLKDLRDTMLSTEQGTEEFNEALVKSAEIQHTLKEQMELVNASAMDFGQIASNVTKTMGGMIAGFQSAKAVMNLFGIENEETIKSLQRMQNMMALTQALPAIDKAIKGFKSLSLAISTATKVTSTFGKALISTGLGAVIAALGLLIANWDKVTEAMKKWGIISEDTSKKLEEQKKKVDALRKSYGDLYTSYRNWETSQKVSKLNEQAKKEYEELATQIQDLTYKEQLARTKAAELWETEGKAAGNAKKAEADAYRTQIELLQRQQKAILDNADSYKKAGKSITGSVDSIKKALEGLNWRISLYDKDELEKEIANFEAAKEKEIEILQQAKEKELITEQEFQTKKKQIEDHYNELKVKATSDYKDKEIKAAIAKEKEKYETEYRLQMANLQKMYDEGILKEEEYVQKKKDITANYVRDYAYYLQKMLDTQNISDKSLTLGITETINSLRQMLQDDMSEAERQQEEYKNRLLQYADDYREELLTIDERYEREGLMMAEAFFLENRLLDKEFKEESLKAEKEYKEAKEQIIYDYTDFEISKEQKEMLEKLDDEYHVQTLQAEEDYQQKVNQIKEDYNKMNLDMTKRYRKMELEETMRAVGAVSTYLDSFAQMFASIASIEDKESEESLAKYKDLMSTSTLISTLVGIVNAVSSAFSPMNAWMGVIGQSIMAGVMSASVLASGIASIINIQKEQLPGGTTFNGSSVSTPSMNAVNEIVAPVQYTQDVQGANIENAISNNRVYVVESDITDTQKKVDVTETESRY